MGLFFILVGAVQLYCILMPGTFGLQDEQRQMMFITAPMSLIPGLFMAKRRFEYLKRTRKHVALTSGDAKHTLEQMYSPSGVITCPVCKMANVIPTPDPDGVMFSCNICRNDVAVTSDGETTTTYAIRKKASG